MGMPRRLYFHVDGKRVNSWRALRTMLRDSCSSRQSVNSGSSSSPGGCHGPVDDVASRSSPSTEDSSVSSSGSMLSMAVSWSADESSVSSLAALGGGAGPVGWTAPPSRPVDLAKKERFGVGKEVKSLSSFWAMLDGWVAFFFSILPGAGGRRLVVVVVAAVVVWADDEPRRVLP